jgi:hypothetical protein
MENNDRQSRPAQIVERVTRGWWDFDYESQRLFEITTEASRPRTEHEHAVEGRVRAVTTPARLPSV